MEMDKYTYRVFWWEEDECFVAKCGELPSISGLGETPETALVEAREAVAAALEWIEEDGEEVPAPQMMKDYKGKILLRVSASTHRMISMRAEEEGQSVNQFLSSLIEKNLYSDTVEKNMEQLRFLTRLTLTEYSEQKNSTAKI